MKKLVSWIIIATCLGACGMRDKTSKTIERGRRAGDTTSEQARFLKNNENVTLHWGEVIANPNDPYLQNDTNGNVQAAFMDAVSGLMEATLPVEAIGWVSGKSGLNPSVYGMNIPQWSAPTTGVRFIGRIALTPDGKQIDTAKTALRIVIYDEFTGQTIDGQKIPEYPIFFDKAQDAYFDSNTKDVYLAFSDNYGAIYMEGRYNGSYFVGTMAYDNTTTAVENGFPAAGTLGTFQVPTCGILLEVAECQSQQ